MRKLKNILVGLIIFFSCGLSAQDLKKANSLLEKRGEVYLKIEYPVSANIAEITNKMSIDKFLVNKDKKEVYSYLNKKQFEQFKLQGANYKVLTPPSMKAATTMCINTSGVKNWNCYPTYGQYIATMEAFQSAYPNLCKLVEFGQSEDGRKLLAVKISDNVNTKEEEPTFLYTSTMHGDETSAYVLMLRLIDYLLDNYDADSRVADIVNTTEIWINPLANPDGAYSGGNSSLIGATRSNSNGIDLNRNFPEPGGGEHPDGNLWQAETVAMMDFMKDKNFVLAANFHDGAEVVNYPWDIWSKRHADDIWYQEIAREYVDTVHANSSAYMTGFDNGITNGYDWYTTSGNRQDYLNYYLHGREVTVEVSGVKLIDPSAIPAFWNYNYRSFLNYINRVHTGVYGKITDQDGLPIKARVSIVGHDADSSEVYSGAANGMYYRMLLQGDYQINATLSGYAPAQYSVTVGSNLKIELNITLNKYPESVYTPKNDFIEITRYNNPVSSFLDFEIKLKEPGDFELCIYDVSGKKIKQKTIVGNSGLNKLSVDFLDVKEGIYLCHIHSKLFSSKLKIVKL